MKFYRTGKYGKEMLIIEDFTEEIFNLIWNLLKDLKRLNKK